MQAEEYQVARSALFAIDPNVPRKEWAKVAASWAAAAGPEGEDDFVEWSSGGESFVERDARATYRWALKPSSGRAVGEGTLYWMAAREGWERPASNNALTKEERQEIGKQRYLRRKKADARRTEAEKRERNAAKAAASMFKRSALSLHPYLVAKGFANERGFVLNGELLLPMMDAHGKLWSLQRISGGGGKLYLSGGRASGMRLNMGGMGDRTWFCEGYATALSVRYALRVMRIPDRVVTCFSSDGIAKVSKGCRNGVVVADHDWWRCGRPKNECGHRWDGDWQQRQCPRCGNISVTPPAGEKSARETGLPWWMPPSAGEDANDVYKRSGAAHLGGILKDFSERT